VARGRAGDVGGGGRGASRSDATVRSLQAEDRRSLATFITLRRVFASATAPERRGQPAEARRRPSNGDAIRAVSPRMTTTYSLGFVTESLPSRTNWSAGPACA
jgi:hypothetical protein